MAVYDINGTNIDESSGAGQAINYDSVVQSVNHRGFNTIAPENTIPAFKLSKQRGFNFVETDISFTSDGVAVLLHDATINRTARNADGSAIENTINIGGITYEQALEYDFGIWKNQRYAGTKIPTLAQFLALCREIMLHPYIELKDNGNYTEAQIQSIVDMVRAYGLDGKVSYISFSATYLGYVKNYNSHAILGLLRSSGTTGDITTCQNLKTTGNEIFYAPKYTSITDALCTAYAAANIPLRGVWTVDTANAIKALNSYVSGVTSNSLIAGKILYDANIT